MGQHREKISIYRSAWRDVKFLLAGLRFRRSVR